MFAFSGNPAFFIVIGVNQKDKKKAAHLEDTLFLEGAAFIMLSNVFGKSDHY